MEEERGSGHFADVQRTIRTQSRRRCGNVVHVLCSMKQSGVANLNDAVIEGY